MRSHEEIVDDRVTRARVAISSLPDSVLTHDDVVVGTIVLRPAITAIDFFWNVTSTRSSALPSSSTTPNSTVTVVDTLQSIWAEPVSDPRDSVGGSALIEHVYLLKPADWVAKATPLELAHARATRVTTAAARRLEYTERFYRISWWTATHRRQSTLQLEKPSLF